MQTNNKMAVTPVGRLILQMSIPPLISMFLQYSYNLIYMNVHFSFRCPLYCLLFITSFQSRFYPAQRGKRRHHRRIHSGF